MPAPAARVRYRRAGGGKELFPCRGLKCPSFPPFIADYARRRIPTIHPSESRSPSMTSVTSSTSTITSPYATVKEQIRPGRFESNEKEYGTVGAAVLGVGDAISEGAS